MTSTIKVNNIQNQCGANIINENSNTITLGASGDTIALASGASQTGFGRTGTVNWVTTKKTTNFTAVSGEGYFCDTAASGAFTLTLPSSPSAGDIVGLKDYNGNFATANLTIGRGGSPINGANASDVIIKTAGASIFLVYVDASQGWVATQDDSSTFAGESFMVATGGTITTCGDDKIHTFTSPGTFTVCSVSGCAANNLVSYMVVGGGGGSAADRGGGGGAGGFRETKSPATPYTASPLDGYSTPGNRITVTATGFPIAVGAGGAANNSPPFTIGASGSVSTFSTISSAGGGGGGRSSTGANGGSGGASGSTGSGCTSKAGGSGNTPSTTPPQGNNAGTTHDNPAYAQGGGGGATAVGGNATAGVGGPGGAGATTSINGSATALAGGGGGGTDCGSANKGTGGPGGGGCGASGPYPGSSIAATNGTANTGGGGGGSNGGGGSVNGGNGGSGIVIIRYKFQ
jgi:hypothetical protein